MGKGTLLRASRDFGKRTRKGNKEAAEVDRSSGGHHAKSRTLAPRPREPPDDVHAASPNRRAKKG